MVPSLSPDFLLDLFLKVISYVHSVAVVSTLRARHFPLRIDTCINSLKIRSICSWEVCKKKQI